MIMIFPLVFLFIEDEDDRLFLEGLYMAHHDLMYAQALKITRNSQEAEDAVSEGGKVHHCLFQGWPPFPDPC